ncbi:MaoC family dehydratase [Mycobacterium sp. HNNTM2301]|uniref:MaoC family dehydratase n=1 Tax=Mycobacterium hainanense TaxID=3289775 RepID=UPI0035A6C944
MSTSDYQSVEIGDKIPTFVRTTSFAEWNRYAAVNDEFIPIHMDDDAGRAAGNEAGAFGMGNLRLGYVVNMLRGWLGDDGQIVSLSARHRRLNQKGDELRCEGEVVGKELVDGRALVHVQFNVVNQLDEAISTGEATVALADR